MNFFNAPTPTKRKPAADPSPALASQVRALKKELKTLKENQNKFQVAKLKHLASNIRNQYTAAKNNRVRADWSTANNTPYRNIAPDIATLISRSRHAYDNDPIYFAAVNTIASNVIGRGIEPKANVLLKNKQPNKPVNQALNDAWERYQDEWDRREMMTFGEAQALAFRTTVVSGGVLTNTVRGVSGALLPIAKQLIEPDRLDPSHDNEQVTLFDNVPAAQTLHGINVDQYGRPLSYWIKGVDKPIRARNINHTFLHERPEQYLGVPWGRSVLEQIWDIHQLHEDTLIKSRALADFIWWMNPESDGWSQDGDKDDDNNAILESLSFLKTPNKPEVIRGDDTITQSVQPLTKMIMNNIAAGFGMSYMTITKDLTDVNFAASRNVVMEERRNYRIIQQWWIRSFCQVEWNDFVFWAVLTGQVPQLSIDKYLADKFRYTGCQWQCEGWDWVDPLKDSTADIAMRTAGLATDKELLGKRGRDLETHYRQLAEEAALRKKYGVEIEAPVNNNLTNNNSDPDNNNDGTGNDE